MSPANIYIYIIHIQPFLIIESVNVSLCII